MNCDWNCPHCNAPDIEPESDFEAFNGVCPHCDEVFDDEDDWFEHTSCCEQDGEE